MKQPTNAADPSPLKRAFLALEKMEAELQLLKYKQHEPIAIIGMGCSYPGASESPERFWQNLLAGFDAIDELPAGRAADLRYGSAHPAATSHGQRGSFLAQVDGFDPAFFGLAPREVTVMDPAHRLLLETVWQALEEANLVPATLFNSDMGVFIGGGTSGYLNFCADQAHDLYTATGNVASTAAGRISYLLGVTGPCVAIDTACSSSLVAIHLACQSLRNGECSTALAGGVNLLLDTEFTAMFANGNMLSAEARCKTFDAAADGYVRGEGCGVLVLKRLSDAQAAQDHIVAVIRGTAVNQDGPSGGLTIPSGPSQEQVIRRALADAGLRPEQIGYIEAHGTGTPLGDPIEIGALSAVFGSRTSPQSKERTTPLYVGSVKTNVGHLEMAAGVVGLMKLVLALRNGVIPPHLHFHTPNPHIDWKTAPVHVPTVATPWPRPVDGERIGGVSSFGFSGTNAHVIVGEAPIGEGVEGRGQRAVDRGQKTEDGGQWAEDRGQKTGGRGQEAEKRRYHLLTIAAKTDEALAAYAERYLDFLRAHPDLDLGDLCYTSHVSRSHYHHRLALAASSVAELQQQLVDYHATQGATGLNQGVVNPTVPTPKLAFLFTGQGSQYVDMGRELYATNATFRATLDRCEALYQAETGASLLAVLYPEQRAEGSGQGAEDRRQRAEGSGQRTEGRGQGEQAEGQKLNFTIDDTTYTQPALFALEVALATLWQSWGIQPDLLIGHSVGEVAAACVAGVFSLEDGMKLIAARGRLMGALPQDGAMMAVQADEAQVQRAIAAYAAATSTSAVAIAAVNGPESVVIAGKREAVSTLVEQLAAEGIKSRPLIVSHAFHSPLMDPMLDAFREVAATITYHQPKRRLISNVTGKLAGPDIATPAYWVRHVRDTVRFADGVATLQAHGVDTFLEIGPKPVLIGMAGAVSSTPKPADSEQRTEASQPLTPSALHLVMLPSLRANQPDWQSLLTTLGALYVRGAAIDWAGLDRDEPRRKIGLPTYPFQRQRYWVEPTNAIEADDKPKTGFAHWLATHSIEQLTDLVTQRRAFDATEQATLAKVLAALAEESHTQQLTAQVEEMLYTLAWEPQRVGLPRQAPATPGRWLILADGSGVGAALAARLADFGEAVDIVPATAPAADWEDQLHQVLAAESVLPLRGVLHLWALDAGLSDDNAGLVPGLQRPLTSALQLVQRLATMTTAKAPLPRLWLVTQGAQSLAATEPMAPAQTPLWGLGRVIALEHSELWGGLVDLDGSADPTACAEALLAEILQAAPDGETEVAYRHQTRHGARLVRTRSKPAAPPPLVIHADATYLITGGLGALGLLVAEWLAEAGARHLILTGRRGITLPAQQTVIDRLTANGIGVTIAQVDVADEAAMRALFTQIGAETLPLRGVVHTAGILDDAILLNQHWDRFAAVFASKVTGGWLLHELTQGLELDFMLFFSSLAALVGNPGQGNYAAANAFLDGLAHYRQQQGLPALSINWDAWTGSKDLPGMAVRTGQRVSAPDQAITPALGKAALAYLLQKHVTGQIAVAAIDWTQVAQTARQPQRRYANFVTPAAPAQAKATLVQTLETLPVNQRVEYLRRHLQGVVGRVLGRRDLPARTTGFTDLGMDSLMALELRRALEREVNHALPTTLAFEYPTVEKLAAYLLDLMEIGDERPATTTGAPSRQSPVFSLNEPIAVISMACRFPGADTPEAFWQLLCQGLDMVQPVPATRWPAAAFYDPQRPHPGKMYTQEAAFIQDVEQFDPLFFGIAPREAVGMDPQHRLLLETGWEALERAGLVPAKLVESQTGVFIGIGEGDYGAVDGGALTDLDTYAATNTGHSIAAGRLAYTLGLQGPTLAVDTACSSSLVALHLACQSLRGGECDLALAGGVNLMLAPLTHIALSQMGALSPDGRCKTFDAAADGYGRGEGGGMVVLKRLADATRDGDTVLALIKGSAVNHDGPSSGLTVPNRQAQEKLLHQALAQAQVTPAAITYVEAHGTGTPLGDPIELRALNAVFGHNRETPLLVGSVKTNVGHLEAAAGIVGFIKTVLALQHRQIPPHLHFHTPTPHVAWDELTITVPTTLQPWPASALVAGVSSFGISGTNAHVIVAAPETGEQRTEDRGQRTEGRGQRTGDRGQTWQLLPLAAKTEEALVELAGRYHRHLEVTPDLALDDLCYAAATERSSFAQRLAIVATDTPDLLTKLATVAQDSASSGMVRGVVAPDAARIAFLFTGQGAQYVDMGRELYATNATFRATLDRCETLYRAETGASLLAVLYPEQRAEDRGQKTEGSGQRVVGREQGAEDRGEGRQAESQNLQATIDDTTYTQPALFALEYALATLWQSWGIQPDILLGHSVGEVAAACVAGVFSLEDGIKLIAARGRLMGALPQNGTMVAIMAEEACVHAAIAPYMNEVALAAVNGPANIVIAGQTARVLAIADQLAAEGIKTRPLTVSHAFHSPLMEPILDAFRQVAATIAYHVPQIPLVSNVTGQLAGAEIMTPDYWVRHVRDTVRFADGVVTLEEQGINTFLEIGPQPVLVGMAGAVVREQAEGRGQRTEGRGQRAEDRGQRTGDRGQGTEDGYSVTLSPTRLVMLPSLRANQSAGHTMLTTLGTLYVRGCNIDWAGFHQGAPRRKVLLPTYPFQRQRYWVDRAQSQRGGSVLSPLLDKMVQLPTTQETLFETAMSATTLPFLRDHRVDDTIVAPGACHLAMVLNAAQLAWPLENRDGQLLSLTDVIFPQPLVIGDDETRTAQVLLTPTQTNGNAEAARFQLLSFGAHTTAAMIATTLHAQGSVGMTNWASTTALALSAVQERCGEAVDVEARLAADESPLVFGPAFRWIEAAWQNPQNGAEVLTRLRRPAAIASLAGHPIHPGLLDGCFQTPGLIPQFAPQAGELWLPFAVAALQLHDNADHLSTAESWWCHTEQVGTSAWNIRLFADGGQPLLAIDGFQLRLTPSSVLQSTTLHTDWLQALTWQATPLPAASPTVLPDCWLLVGQAAALQNRLAATASPVRSATAGDFQQIVAELAARQQKVGVIYLGGATEIAAATSTPPAQATHLGSELLQLTQALLATELSAHLWVVTQGCQQPTPTTAITNIAAGTLWGMARTIAQEQPQLRCVCVDLDQTPDALAQHLYAEVVSGWGREAVDGQIAYANGERYVAQVGPWQAPVTPAPTHPMRLRLEAYGSLDQLTFVPLTRRSPGAGEIELEVKAVGLNFRDVLNALGLLQAYYATVLDIHNAQEVGLGFECAGVVTVVGDGVTHVTVGDRVMGLVTSEGAFASYLTLPAAQMTPTPAAITDVEAATLPMAFLTAWYGLVERAQLQPGEWVLIHAASGGVGQAAVQIAQAIGAQVIATASPGKWETLRQQGITHLLNSRTLTFADEVRRLTAGAGVAVVLNSLNGDFIEQSFAALGQGGRFVEIGKLGIWSPAQVAAQRPDVAYHPFDLGEVLAAAPSLYAHLWQAITTRVQAGAFRPLPQTVFPAAETVAAFRYMQGAKQVGKIVVDFAQAAAVTLQADAAYLITGGLGALGLTVAQQLVAAGARQLVLTGRQGVTTASQQQMLATLREAGAHVVVIPTDMADANAVKALIDQATALAPLRGIVHAAGVLDDGVLTAQTPERLINVMRPKVDGAWHLHTFTRDLALDFFLCFSSAAALLGAAGQSNYAAANAFMDTLMQQRRQQGLPGLSINWGPWAGTKELPGMAAHLQTQMAAQGLTMISAQQGSQLFQHLLERSGQLRGQIGVIPLQRAPAASQRVRGRATTHDLRTELLALSADERSQRLEAYLRREIATVLGLPPTLLLDARARLFDLGLDSLMAVELKNRIEAGLRCSVRATLLFDYPTLEVLTPYLLQEVLKLPETKPVSVKQVRATQNNAAPATMHEPIAIIGMACHYPGGVDTPAEFWRQLVAGFDGIIDLPPQRAVDIGMTTATTAYAHRGGFLAAVDTFDATFFGLSPREVVVMDPAHRLLLETAWQALEDAQLIPAQLFNQEIGVFVGGGFSGYLPAGAQQSNVYAATGNTASTAAGRLSYIFGFTGPAMAVDTACSSSLVAIHLACQSLRNRECDAALAGGVNLILEGETTTMFASGNLLSADARCKTFDAAANGYVRGEGCGLIVLKRLADAEADGDPIVAVIRGTAVNQDGPSSGLTVPNGPSQERVIRRALADANLTPQQLSYVEAHGTGTPLGDPIEIGALSTVFQERNTPLYVGSVKTNVGHLEAAAGVAGLMKLVLALHHCQIPPHRHFHTPNPHIDWATIPVQVPTTLIDWTCPEGVSTRIGGVSSFGFSGTNAHVIVEEAPVRERAEGRGQRTEDRGQGAEDRGQRTEGRDYHLLTVAAKSGEALRAYAVQYGALLAAQPMVNLGDLCYAAQTGRSPFPYRLSLVATSAADLQGQLLAYTTGTATETIQQGQVSAGGATPKLAFLFTGQGAQYLHMGRDLYRCAPVFRAIIDRCEAVMQAELGRSLLELLYPATAPAHNDLLESHPCGQAVNFALECALADLWRSWGVHPHTVLGHSLGDFAAAYTAGVLSLEDGLRLVITRGRLMEGAIGSMVSVLATETDVAPFLTAVDDVAIGVINGPKSLVISGAQAPVAAITAQINAAGFKTRKLDIPVAAHSPLLDPVLADFEAAVRQVKLAPPQLPVVSSMTGQLVTTELTDPAYWRQHLRNTVRFADGVTTLLAQGVDTFIEIGPKPVLLGMVESSYELRLTNYAAAMHDGISLTRHSKLVTLPSLRENQPDWRQMLMGLGELYVRGVAINWAGVNQGEQRDPVTLPTYPFQRQRYWIEGRAADTHQPATGLRPLLDKMTKAPRRQETIFETAFSVERFPFLADHRVYTAVISPGACQLALALSAAEVLCDRDQSTALGLENVILPQALLLPADASRTVQTILTGQARKGRPATAARYEFEIISFTGEDESEPAVHATGMVTTGLAEDTLVDGRPDLASLRQRCEQAVDVAAFYQTMAAAQIEFGPAFQWIQEAWQGYGDSPATLARLVLPAELTPATAHLLHPGLLDACFQVAGLARSPQQDEETRLPFAVERLTLDGALPMQHEEWWCYAVQRAADKWDIALLDDQSHSLVQIQGYEVRSAPAASIQGLDRWRDSLYHIRWQPKPYLGLLPDYLPPPAEIAAKLRGQVAALWEAAGGAREQALARGLEQASLAYVVAALVEGGFTFHPGVQWPTAQLAQQVGVIPSYRRLFHRLLTMLAEEGILQRIGEQWAVRQAPPVVDPTPMLAALAASVGTAPEVQLLMRCGAQLRAVLRGAQEPLALLFPGGDDTVTAALYTASAGAQVMNKLIAQLVQQACDQLPPERGIRIVEIGAGTGGTTAGLLPLLPSDRTDYLFTDIGPTFLAQAQKRFADYSFVRYQPLDIEQTPATQGLEMGQADLVIAANVLHATKDLAETVAHVHELLQPGGQLLLLETTTPSRWVDLTFGLTDGWWRFADARQDHPLLTAAQWQSLLQTHGFPTVEVIEHEGQAVIIAQAATLTGSVAEPSSAARGANGQAASASTSSAGGEAWLIFADAQGVGAALAHQLQQRGAQTQLVYRGQSNGAFDAQTLYLQPTCAADYQRLLTAGSAPRGIVYLWGVDTPTPNGESDLVAAAQMGCGAALHLIQALLQTGSTPTRLWLVTQAAQAVAPGDKVHGYQQALLWGLGRVLAQEHPELACVCVDLAGTPITPEEQAAQLCAEVLGHTPQEQQVALRQDARYVARLTRFVPEPQPSLVCDPAATYLITGGLGGIGLATAEWLAAQGARHLLLVGRSRPKPDAQSQIEALRAQGVTVTVDQCDVTDRAQVERVLDGIAAAHPLRGVIHSVGVLDNGALVHQSWERFATVLAPKVQGAWHLHTLTHGMALDFFVLYSSAAGLLGSLGQANHAAANAFLDAFAHYRQGQQQPALSINWGAWAAIGSAATFVEQTSNATRGYRAITPELGIAALAGLLPQPTPQVGVIPFDWRAFTPETAAERAFYAEFFAQTGMTTAALSPAAGSQPPLREQLATATPQAADALLTTYLQQAVAQILQMNGLPNPTSGFHEMGMDSLMTIELRRRLEKGLSVSLPSTIVFEYPTVAALKQYLWQEVLRLTPPDAPKLSSAERAAAHELVSQHGHDSESLNTDLDALSDAELNALLAQELALLEE